MGDNCKVQNYALVYEPAVIDDGVFIGPAVTLTNDHFPRAVNPDGTIKSASDWGARRGNHQDRRGDRCTQRMCSSGNHWGLGYSGSWRRGHQGCARLCAGSGRARTPYCLGW